MRKIYLIIFALCFSLGNMAQVKTDGRWNMGGTSSSGLALSVPKEFCYNNTPLIQMYDGSSSGSESTLLIYDEDLNLKETLNIGGDKTFNYQLTYQDEQREIESVTVVRESEDCLNQSYDDFVRQTSMMSPSFNESMLTITEEGNGSKLIIFDYSADSFFSGRLDQYYFGYSYFGTKYPTTYFRCKNDVMYRYRATYKITYGEWQVVGTHTEDMHYTYRRLYLYNINLNEGDGRANYYFEASQTLFNTDEAFEYLVPKYVMSAQGEGSASEAVPYNENTIITTRTTVITEKSKVVFAGFQVMSSDGTVIRDLDFEPGFVSPSINDKVYVVTIGFKTYLAFSGYQDGKDCTVFYQIDRQTAEIRRVSTTRGSFVVSPTVIEKNTPISISFGDDNRNGSDVFVYSASGSRLKQQSVPAGEKGAQLSVNTNPGMYIVARRQPGKAAEAQKIIVK